MPERSALPVVAVFAALFLAVPYLSPAHAASASASVQVVVAQPQPVPAGANFDYVISVSSEGPDDAANVQLVFPLPGGTSFQAVSAPAGWTCNAIVPGTMAPTVTCTTPAFSPGTAAFTITASTPPTASGTFSTTATVNSTTPDPSDNDNSFPIEVLVQPSTDFSATLSAVPNPVNAGSNVTWTMTATNNGPSAGTAATVDLPLPAETTFVSLSAPAGWSCTAPSVGSSGTVSCSLTGSMNPSTSATFAVVSRLVSSTPAGTPITTTATVSSTNDAIPANDFASASVQSAVFVQLVVTKVFSSGLAFPGAPVQYKITVTNNGPSNAPGVTMTDVLTPPHRFASFVHPAGWSCTTPAVGSTGTIACSLPSMIAAEVSTFTLNTFVDPAATAGMALINNVNVVSSTGASNVAGTATVVATPPNVVPSKSVNSGAHFEGSVVTYTIVLTNSGTLAQPDNPGNELTDVLPSSLTLVSASATTGTAAANIGTNTVTWNGTVAGGSSVTITIQATVKSGTLGATISNQASVSYDSDWNGTNESTRQSDDPATGTPSDPTSFVVLANVPALSNLMLILLTAALAAMSLILMRK
ncbi:MAG: uncharacterized protein QOC81_1692 [Thermoanaerobaculia bacterium]|nr:uncharacterized protein [Thermoanaerobaculia bacterium]